MRGYAVFRTPIFDKKFYGLSNDFQEQIKNIEEQLESDPYVGKPLNVRWFREKRLEDKRIYYLIYDDLRAVYIITISGKKDQQKTINTIRLFLDKYREEIEVLTT